MIISPENFALFAAKKYENICYTEQEFQEDLNRFRYLKRLFYKYSETGDLKIRLMLNHIIIIYNVFGSFATELLFFKLKEYWPQLKPFVVALGNNPEQLMYIEKYPVFTADIQMDQVIVNALRNEIR